MRWISTVALALLAGIMASGVEQPKRIDQNGVVGSVVMTAAGLLSYQIISTR
ncbi:MULTISPECIES: hypothetical protein [Pseudomonas syringae group]|uniref:hypothetical protein n=1 Tax=Pseudomonas syringae group TaxID=136849 RepID=UPI000A237EAF|nr:MULTISPECIES: hypothetical protein [Pseudomonas syringae group]MBL3635536.1 hypothetical protein [Pseudomonas syringae pv. actinidiae]MDU8584052.1 hypothetical protein [Pseudomonas syringae pv. actinidiae]OSR90195.1 hypothetical protein BV329_00344 [Pseudomonas syringae pv. actinidiae]